MGMVNSYDDLVTHIGHEIKCVYYGKDGVIWNVAIECHTCNYVLVDYNRPDVAEALQEGTDEETVNVILSMKGGLPYEGPFVTEDKHQARQTYKAYCKSLDLPTGDPHDGESDVFWWTVKVGVEAQEITPW